MPVSKESEKMEEGGHIAVTMLTTTGRPILVSEAFRSWAGWAWTSNNVIKMIKVIVKVWSEFMVAGNGLRLQGI
jgi:hypothetical protein